MTRTLSRERRRAAFLEKAGRMFDNLEGWYNQHEAASFGEIEVEARRRRRAMMGQALKILVNERDRGIS